MARSLNHEIQVTVTYKLYQVICSVQLTDLFMYDVNP